MKMNGRNSSLGQEQLKDRDFRFLSNLVYEQTGIVLGDSKRDMVCRRIMRRKRALQLASYKEYCELLKQDESQELPNFINSITTNLTSFFREPHHFQYLAEYIKQQEQNRRSQRLRIWSAACSTGEEPYSIAISMAQALQSTLQSWDVKILATDLDTNALAVAKTGVYEFESCKSLPQAMLSRWFSQGTGGNAGLVKVKPELQQYITFKQLNFMDSWPLNGPFDAIMCRNVLIYFDRPTQIELLSRFVQLLRPGGLLFLGHSESAGKEMDELETKGRTIFAKRE